jgi:hypothetical protein
MIEQLNLVPKLPEVLDEVSRLPVRPVVHASVEGENPYFAHFKTPVLKSRRQRQGLWSVNLGYSIESSRCPDPKNSKRLHRWISSFVGGFLKFSRRGCVIQSCRSADASG